MVLSEILINSSGCAVQGLLNPHGRQITAGGPRDRKKAPDCVKWPERHAAPTLCGSRGLENVIHAASRLAKPLIHDKHPFRGQWTPTGCGDSWLIPSGGKEGASQRRAARQMSTGQALSPKTPGTSGPGGRLLSLL